MATNLAPFLNVFVGDSGSGGTIGLVPAPPAGAAAAGYFLSAGAIWSMPSGSGGGVTTVGTLDGGTANANAATITGTSIFLQSASSGFSGLINTVSQTISGAKTFASPLTTLGSMTAIGTGSFGSLSVTGYATSASFNSGVTGNAATGTITLTNTSTQIQNFSSGSGSAICILPDATTLTNGATFKFNNNATGVITVQSNGGGSITSMAAGSYLTLILLSNSFSAGQWDYHWENPSNVVFGTAGLAITGTLSSTSTLSTTSNLTVGTTLGVTGATTLSSTLGVTGATTLSSTLGVSGTATFSGAATVGTTLGVTGATTLSSTLGVSGTATFSGAATVGTTLGVTGATTLSSTLGVTGLITASNGLTSSNNITCAGAIYANGGVRNVATQTGGTGNITLNINSAPFNYLSQTGNNNVTLTGTSFSFGGGFLLINSSNFIISVLASNAAEIGKILPNSMVQVIANTVAPSTPSGWNFQNLSPVPNYVANAFDANQSLTVTGARIFNANPTANRTFTLPSATTKLGDQFVMYNISTTSNIAVVAADATPVCTIYPQSTATMSSLAATTSTNTNWSTSLGPQTGFYQSISSNTTLTIYSNRRIAFNPTASVTITLPSTGVPFGDVWQFYNASFTNTITINASDATTITILYPQCRSFLNATVASPATFTSWFASSISTTNVYGLTGGAVSTAGTIGENTSASASAVSATTSGNYGDIASMTLQSGIWSLTCQFVILTQSLTTTAVSFGISTNPGNNSSGLVSGQNLMPCYVPPTSGISCGGTISSFIVNPATATTYYFKYTTSWASTAPLVSGSISAIRVG